MIKDFYQQVWKHCRNKFLCEILWLKSMGMQLKSKTGAIKIWTCFSFCTDFFFLVILDRIWIWVPFPTSVVCVMYLFDLLTKCVTHLQHVLKSESVSHSVISDSVDYTPPGSSVHGSLWVRIPEWVAILLSSGFTQPREWTQASLVAQLVKNPPAMQKTWVQSLGWEDPLEKGKFTHSSILAWRISWTV